MAKNQQQESFGGADSVPAVESDEVKALKAQLAAFQARVAELEAPAPVAAPPAPQQTFRYKMKQNGSVVEVTHPTNQFRIIAPKYIVPNPAKPYFGEFHDAGPKNPKILVLPEGFILDSGFTPVTQAYQAPLPAHAGKVEDRVNIMSGARIQSLPIEEAPPATAQPGLAPAPQFPGFPADPDGRASDRQI